MSSYKMLKKAFEKARADIKRTDGEKEILDSLLTSLEKARDEDKVDIFTVEYEGYIYWLKNKGYWEE